METIEKILDNAFKIKRISTKSGKFKFNEFTRPVTHLDFFQLLANSGINLESNELVYYMCHIKASDYIRNWKGDAHLIIGENYAYIKIGCDLTQHIALDFDKFKEMFVFFKKPTVFNTDFGRMYKSDLYYKK